ncbi:MAG: hypothetical protein N2D54_10265 [Chloroflexota bacterium]
MANLIAFFLFTFALLLQTTLVSQFNLLHGSADLVLLLLLSFVLQRKEQTYWPWAIVAGALVGATTSVPILVIITEYLLVIFVLQLIQAYVWQVPLVVLFVSTFLGTLITNSGDYVYLIFLRVPLPLAESFSLVVLPSIILNIILILPVYSIVGEITKRLYPTKLEI